jgi:hypothetical protein
MNTRVRLGLTEGRRYTGQTGPTCKRHKRKRKGESVEWAGAGEK